MVDVPKTRYARSGDLHIAYQVIGEGALDLVFVPGFISHVENDWDIPVVQGFFRRLASFSRLIRFDKRGTGLSDRVGGTPTLEQRMDDVRAVMDAVGSERAALFGVSEGGPMSILFAATYPERTSALVLYGTYARRSWAPDYPFGWTEDEWEVYLERLERDWGGPWGVELFAPSLAHDENHLKARASYLRAAASPGAAAAIWRMNKDIDVRHVLGAVRLPTMVLHRTGDRVTRIEQGRYLAGHIAGAKFVECQGIDHTPWVGDADTILAETEEFLTGVRHQPDADRVLATVLFIDIVGSTERAVALGDHRWRELLEQYYAVARRALARFRGNEIDTAGDGLFATFDGPARAVRCAGDIVTGVQALGLEVRAGLHTGECEVVGPKVGGIAVHIGARVVAHAAPGQVLASSTVKDLVAGSDLRFADRGTHTLKGIPGEWRLFAVVLD
jgi:class 3 adenylate cyclase